MNFDLRRQVRHAHRQVRHTANQGRLRIRPSSGRIVDKALQFPKIIVKFVKRDTKELFYKSRKKLSGKTTKDIDLGRISDNNIYISESLTAKNRALFKECLKFRRNYKFKYIWTNQGRVYMRRDKDSPSKIISCQADLEGLLEMR